MTWPKPHNYRKKYYVSDLRPNTAKLIFLAESPHKNEIIGSRDKRCPFRGISGKQWWEMLCSITGETFPKTDRKSLFELCTRLEIAVINAVQYPLGNIGDPDKNLGFAKRRHKTLWRLKDENFKEAIKSLEKRLKGNTPVISLGKIADGLLSIALGDITQDRHKGWIPHPSSWNRNQKWKAKAESILKDLLASRNRRNTC